MYNILFFGSDIFSMDTLKSIYNSKLFNISAIITQPDRKSGRGMKLTQNCVASFASQNNIKLFQFEKIRNNILDVQKIITQLEIDINIVIAYGQILPIEILDYPKAKSINIHGSILPRWRGAAPIQYSILTGDATTGITLMRMDQGLDTGDIIITKETAINTNETFDSLKQRLSVIGADLTVNNLESIIKNEVKFIKQNNDNSTYAKKITKQDTIINWDKPAFDIVNMINAFDSFPAAKTFLEKMQVKLFKPELIKEEHSYKPGLVFNISKEFIDIACGADILRIREIQVSGKRRMAIKDFLTGYDILNKEFTNE